MSCGRACGPYPPSEWPEAVPARKLQEPQEELGLPSPWAPSSHLNELPQALLL